jgi:prolyl-tRNA editing enzyme YbaK/EbsC (Cys-tRNA(Pro) deacylase)
MATIVVVPAAIGAGIGALIDALFFERRTVYRTPGQRSSRLQISPFLLKSTAGVQMSVRF